MSSDQSNASATGTDGDESTDRPSREIAYRLFAAEFDDASFSYSESDEERAPNYVVTPTGARLNRMFAVGVLTEVERVNDDVLRGRVVDPTGAFVSYAGQYQPDEMAFLDRASPPAFVALSGKARTFQPEDSDRVFTSVRPESLSRVDGDTRDRWTVSAAEATLDRIAVMAAALDSGLSGGELRDALEAAGVDAPLAAGVPLALDHYGTTPAYLSRVRRLALDALEVVAGDRDSVRALDLAPDEVGDGDVDPASLAADLTLAGETSPPAADDPDAATAGTDVDAGTEGEADADTGATSPSETDAPTSSVSSADTGGGDSAIDDGSTTDVEPTTEDGSATDDGPTTEDGGGAEPAESTPTATTNEPTATANELTATANESAESGEADPNEETTSDASETIETPDSDADEGDELGDFDAGDPEVGDTESEASAETDTTDTAGAADDTAPAGDEMYELDEEERAEIESEYGTEFSTGSEVDPAGEADIDVPSVDELESELDDEPDESGAASDPSDGVDVEEPALTDESGPDAGADSAAGDEGADVDLEAAAVEAMADLDDGDGASREEVVARVVEEYGVDPGDVEDAIQSALMSGQCYEPSEDSLKAI